MIATDECIRPDGGNARTAVAEHRIPGGIGADVVAPDERPRRASVENVDALFAIAGDHVPIPRRCTANGNITSLDRNPALPLHRRSVPRRVRADPVAEDVHPTASHAHGDAKARPTIDDQPADRRFSRRHGQPILRGTEIRPA